VSSPVGVLEWNESRRQDAVLGGARDLAESLAFLWREGGDEDEADDVLRAGGGVRDNRAAVGVADGEDRPRDLLEKRRDVGRVMSDAAERVRGRRYLHVRGQEALDHAVPARSVREGAVDEDDRERFGHERRAP
jgi:hypothetical protein